MPKLTSGRAHILVVDDDALMREVLCDMLETDGYRPHAAVDGLAAWQMLESAEQDFDLVLTDRNMPKLDGMQLLAKIRGDSRFEALPVIFQTALDSRQEIVEGIRAGVFYYLTKPYDRLVLLALVDAAIAETRRNLKLKNSIIGRHFALDLLRTAEFRFKTLAEAGNLALMLAQLSVCPDKAVTGLSELLLNAVEHGNLGISYAEKTELLGQERWQAEIEQRLQLPQYRDKFAQVRIFRSPDLTRFTITDQGAGFDPGQFLSLAPERAMHPHGRGIAMARLLSFDSLEYQGRGNRVQAVMLAGGKG